MSPAQTSLYFREWGKVRRHYIEHGIDPKLTDSKRHELHQKALGYRKSSKEFTNKEFDKVLAVFYAITRPDDLGVQLRQQDQGELRRDEARTRCMDILKEIGIGEGNEAGRAEWLRGAYLDGLVKKVAPPQESFDGLNDKQANVVLGILVRRVLSQRKKLERVPF